MFEGTVVIFEVGLALLKLYEEELLKFSDPIEMLHYLGVRMCTLFDPEILWTNVSCVGVCNNDDLFTSSDSASECSGCANQEVPS
jgi:hypothetical protein